MQQPSQSEPREGDASLCHPYHLQNQIESCCLPAVITGNRLEAYRYLGIILLVKGAGFLMCVHHQEMRHHSPWEMSPFFPDQFVI